MTASDPAAQSLERGTEGAREYGRGGLFGVLAPQGNPVAEAELRILLPPACVVLAARLTSAGATLRERLSDYGERLDELVDQFAGVPLDAAAVACTGAFYGQNSAAGRARAEARFAKRGYPVITAADAVEAALYRLGVGSIAILSPYPAWLTAACESHWQRLGIRVTAILQLPSGLAEPHGIYGLTSTEVLTAAATFDTRNAQAVLLTGTGMPSLRVIQTLEPTLGIPVLSSNLCLAWALARVTGRPEPGPESRLYGGWAARLALS